MVACCPSLPGHGFLSISSVAVPRYSHAQRMLPGIRLLLSEEGRTAEAFVSVHHTSHMTQTRGSPSSHDTCDTLLF